MSVYHVLSIAITLCLTYTDLVSGEGTCTEENINACVAHMVKFNLTHLNTIVPSFDLPTITQICKEYPAAESCMKPLWPDCTSLQRTVYEGLANNYDYICNDTWDEYMMHRECLKLPQLHKEGTQCNETLENNLQILGFYSNHHYRKSKICQYASDYIVCVYNHVENHCGTDAAVWQKGFDISSIDPLMKGLGCVMTGDREGYIYLQGSTKSGSNLSTLILPIVLVLALLVIVCGLIFFLVKKRRKMIAEHHYSGTHAQQHMENGISPAGPVQYANGQVHMTNSPGSGTVPQPAGQLDANGSYLLPPPYTEKEAEPPSYSQNGTVSPDQNPPPPQASGVDLVNPVPMEATGKAKESGDSDETPPTDGHM